MNLINLTPHPIRIYGWDSPQKFESGHEHEPIAVIEPSGEVARIGTNEPPPIEPQPTAGTGDAPDEPQ